MRDRHRPAVLAGLIALGLVGCTAPEPQPFPEPGTPSAAAPATPAAGTPAAGERTPGEAGIAPEPPKGKRSAGQEGEPLLAYRVVGTEPFWGVRVDGDTLHFTTIDDQQGKVLQGSHTLRADGIDYAGEDAGSAFELNLTRAECSDGMSDNRYEYVAAFRYGSTTYQGCAEGAK